MMINRATLVGRLTADPELKYLSSGKAVCRFTLAVPRRFADQEGNRQSDFVDVVAWGKIAENVAEYLGKGRLAGVDGRIQTRTFERDGQKRKVTEVVVESVAFLDGSKKPSSDKPNRSNNDEEECPF